MPPNLLNELLRAGLAHHQDGRLAEAESVYKRILADEPGQGDTMHLLGVLRGQSGQPREAAELIRQAIASSPTPHPAWFSNLGKFLSDAGDFEGAVDACRRSVELKPDFAEGHVNLGNAYRQSGNAAAAAGEYRYAIRLKPDASIGHKLLGATLLALGREHLGDAVAALRESLRLNPADADAANFLGVALRFSGDNAGAVDAFRAAERGKPGSAANNLGNALQALGRLDEAAESYRAILRHAPDFAEAHNNLASVLKEQGDVDGSVDEYRRAVELKPENAAMHSNLLLALNYQFGSTRQSLYDAARDWAKKHADPLAVEIRPHENSREPQRRLRVGYVTADFREHASAFFLLPLLEHHDASQFEVFCYSDVARPDAITARCRRAAHQWREIAGIADARVAEMIRADAIDILVDLKLHADQNRLRVFARKPAPVQVTWLGYPGTTGLSAIDYRLTDSYLDPNPADDPFYAEKTVRLPHSFWCYDPLTTAEVSPLPALRNGHVRFACLNHVSKIGAPLVALWSQVLAAVPRSSLTLLAHEGSHRDRLLNLFTHHGVDSARVLFESPRPRADYLRLYHALDIALDPWPVNGHTTTFDSLWMGVPVVTLTGPTPLGRAGASQLRNVQLEELIAASPADYVRIATKLAEDLDRLAKLRAGLRERMERSPLMDATGFARAMEAEFGGMWRKYCEHRD